MTKTRRVGLAEPVIEVGILHVFEHDAVFVDECDLQKVGRRKRSDAIRIHNVAVHLIPPDEFAVEGYVHRDH